jgi:hypothetical protein
MSDINELIERTKIFEENIRETKIKMINLEHGLYKVILALTELNIEIWKDIKNYEGIYKVSNFGNVINVKTLRILKPSITKGYKRVSLWCNGKGNSCIYID